MKYCVNCGCQLDDSALFCSECGNPVQAAAPEPVQSAESVAEAAESVAEPEIIQDQYEYQNQYAAQDQYAYQSQYAAQDQYSYQGQYAAQDQYTAPQTAQPQRSPGKSIAGFALGISALVMGGIGAIFAFCSLIPYVGVALMVYAIVFGLFAVGCGIAGLILSSQALSVEPDSHRSKLGRTFSLVGLIVGGASIFLGIIFGIIGISRW